MLWSLCWRVSADCCGPWWYPTTKVKVICLMSSLMRGVFTELSLSSVSVLPLHIWWFSIFYLPTKHSPHSSKNDDLLLVLLALGLFTVFFCVVSNIFCLFPVPYANLVLWQLSFYLYESLQCISLSLVVTCAHTHEKCLCIVNLLHHSSVLKYLHATVYYTVLLPL